MDTEEGPRGERRGVRRAVSFEDRFEPSERHEKFPARLMSWEGGVLSPHERYTDLGPSPQWRKSIYANGSLNSSSSLGRTGTLIFNEDGSPEWANDDRRSGRKGQRRSCVADRYKEPEDALDARELPMWRRVCRLVVTSSIFEGVMAIVLLSCAAITGVEQHFRLQGDHTQIFAMIENIFLIIFTLELCLRFGAWGVAACLKENAIKLDVVVVCLSALLAWVVEPLSGGFEQGVQINVLRLCRLLRVSRIVRLTVKFKTLWMLLQGLLSSAGAVGYTLVTLMSITYILGIVIVDLLATHHYAVGPRADPEFQRIIEEHFSSLPRAMLSLVRFVTADSPASIYTPLILKDPWLAFYFMFTLVGLGVVLMNLLTAVVVNRAAEAVLEDKRETIEQQRRLQAKMLMQCQQLFRTLDRDGSGILRKTELISMDEPQIREIEELVGIMDPMDLFKLLDVDGSGSIDMEDFCAGISAKVNGTDWSLWFKRLDKELRGLTKSVEMLTAKQRQASRRQSAEPEMRTLCSSESTSSRRKESNSDERSNLRSRKVSDEKGCGPEEVEEMSSVPRPTGWDVIKACSSAGSRRRNDSNDASRSSSESERPALGVVDVASQTRPLLDPALEVMVARLETLAEEEQARLEEMRCEAERTACIPADTGGTVVHDGTPEGHSPLPPWPPPPLARPFSEDMPLPTLSGPAEPSNRHLPRLPKPHGTPNADGTDEIGPTVARPLSPGRIPTDIPFGRPPAALEGSRRVEISPTKLGTSEPK
eukprot:TRINITY_DN113504_c0_g1_i1.p1 TRINITY_DN113504_c0_g1~~TRINITY_DN113504_c0_g1_i1.p1  ORF type:complete len:788 (-),score=105.42 TRINITY_DN113504_c0_g1_i1:89-2377(-)